MRMKGFTLLELLVGMIATGIVIAAVFSAYHIVGHQAFKYHERSKAASELSLMHSRLLKDCDKADRIQMLTERECLMVSHAEFLNYESEGNEEEQIVYDFRSDYILRIHRQHVDTFFVGVDAIATFRNGIKYDDVGDVVDELQIVLSDGALVMDVHKTYSASAEMLDEYIFICKNEFLP